MYKLYFMLLALVVVSYAELTKEQREKLEEYDVECKEVSHIDDKVLEKARTGEFEDDDKLKEHIFCLSKKIGFQNDAGEVQKDKLKEKLAELINDEAKAEEVVKKCVIEQGTPQETAFKAFKCYSDEAF